MVVDDSRVVHTEMKKLLADTDFEIVGCCRSGEEAIAFYGEHKPDLVTMDIIMPGMDGLAAAAAPSSATGRTRASSWFHHSPMTIQSMNRLKSVQKVLSLSRLNARS